MIRLLALLATAPALVASHPVPGMQRDVIVGRDGLNLDACSSIGRVVNLKPGGDNFLSVRAAPDTRAAEKDRLSAGEIVAMCDKAGSWIGVVYRPPEDTEGCGTSTPSAYIGAYRGPCSYGWVHSDYIELIAG